MPADNSATPAASDGPGSPGGRLGAACGGVRSPGENARDEQRRGQKDTGHARRAVAGNHLVPLVARLCRR